MKPKILSFKEKQLREREPPNERTHRFIEKIGSETMVAQNAQEAKTHARAHQSAQQKTESFLEQFKRWFKF